MGVKDSLTLGREENPWLKGLVGLNIVVEKIYLMMRNCSFFHGVWAPLKSYASSCFWGIIVCVRRRGFYDSHESQRCNCNLVFCYGYDILLFEESTLTQCVNDSNSESMCKPWKGLSCVVFCIFMHYQILYVCIPFGLVSFAWWVAS